MSTTQMSYPLAWIRDEWKPAGNWNVRHSRGLNWAYLSDCQLLHKKTVECVVAGHAEAAEVYGRALAHWALVYLRGRW